jgi:hypothetical protein
MYHNPLPVGIGAQWPWQPRFARMNSWRMRYIDEGTATRSFCCAATRLGASATVLSFMLSPPR